VLHSCHACVAHVSQPSRCCISITHVLPLYHIGQDCLPIALQVKYTHHTFNFPHVSDYIQRFLCIYMRTIRIFTHSLPCMFAYVFPKVSYSIICMCSLYMRAHVFLSRQANDNLICVRLTYVNESGTNHLIPLFFRHLSFLFPLFSITYNFLCRICIFPIALSESM
jgi:hypothetical protein